MREDVAMMRSPALLIPALLASMALLGGCNDSKPKGVDAATAAKTCAQVTIDALSMSQQMTSAAFAHKPTPAELKDLDTSLAGLRNRLKSLTPDQRLKLSALLEAAAAARQHLVDGKSVDAAAVSLAQQDLAKACALG